MVEPPIDIIKCRGIYGRANTPKSTMFYASLDESSTITELRVDIGDLITISEWKQEKSFKILPIILDDKYKSCNKITSDEAKNLSKMIATYRKSHCSECVKNTFTNQHLVDDEEGNWIYIEICGGCHAPKEGISIEEY